MSAPRDHGEEAAVPWPGERAVDFMVKYRLWQILPTPFALIVNRVRVRNPADMPDLPSDAWAIAERRALLADSQGRMASLEGKGPGLATVTAVVVAGSALAISAGWDESDLLAKIILLLAAVFTFFSLLTPIYLVGPIKHPSITSASLGSAAETEHPEHTVAELAADTAMANDVTNQRIANLLDAARRELYYSLVLLVLWLATVPLTGLLRVTPSPTSPPSLTAGPCTIPHPHAPFCVSF
jgi:hypothetical protein